MRRVGIWIAPALLVWLAIDAGAALVAATGASPRRMSFHNRLLLNRAVISGVDKLEVMLLVRDHGLAPATALVEHLGGRVPFDGRGVTVAILESALPEFTHPTLRNAKSLDGRDIPKLAGILNTDSLDEADESRVELDRDVRAASAWCEVDGRTYIVPHPGRYRLGVYSMPAGDNLVERFGVLEDETTHDIRVDTNGDADFRDEKPIVDVNERMDVRALKVTYPVRRS